MFFLFDYDSQEVKCATAQPETGPGFEGNTGSPLHTKNFHSESTFVSPISS